MLELDKYSQKGEDEYLTERIKRLKEASLNLLHAKYREVKDLTILDDEKVRTEPLVVRKAMALVLLLDETSTVIMEDELIVGLRTIYGFLREGENVLGRFDFELTMEPIGQGFCVKTYPHYLLEEELEEAVKQMNIPDSPKQRKWLYKAGSGFAMLWFFFHIFPLYVMIGTPISAGFFLIIMFNALFMIPSIIYLYEKAI